MTQQVQKTKKQYVQEMVTVLLDIEALNQDLNSIKDSSKNDGFNSGLLLTVAKSLANAKLKSLEEKSEELLELIKEVS